MRDRGLAAPRRLDPVSALEAFIGGPPTGPWRRGRPGSTTGSSTAHCPVRRRRSDLQVGGFRSARDERGRVQAAPAGEGRLRPGLHPRDCPAVGVRAVGATPHGRLVLLAGALPAAGRPVPDVRGRRWPRVDDETICTIGPRLAALLQAAGTRRQAAGGFRETGLHPYNAIAHASLRDRDRWLELGETFPPLARQIAEPAAVRFMDGKGGFMREFFDGEWRPAPGEAGRVIERGHQFEWAWRRTSRPAAAPGPFHHPRGVDGGSAPAKRAAGLYDARRFRRRQRAGSVWLTPPPMLTTPTSSFGGDDA